MHFDSTGADPFSKASNYRMSFLAKVSTKVNAFIGSSNVRNIGGQIGFMATLSIIAGFGVFIAIPSMYRDSDFQESTVCTLQAVGIVLFTESLINWMCAKCVDTSYDPAIYAAGNAVVEIKGLVLSSTGTNDTNINWKHQSTAGAKNTTIPYFSWCPCIRCDRPRPPRCHHCPICNKCILKRDHHCFFTGTCIGYKNLRHFVVMLLWTSVACVFAAIHMVPYYTMYIYPHTSALFLVPLVVIPIVIAYLYPDSSVPFLIPMVGVPVVITGMLQFSHFILFVIADALIYYTVYSIHYFKFTASCVYGGTTWFETNSSLNIKDTRDFQGRMRAVFGHYWCLNVFVPLHCVFDPIDDPLSWPTIEFSAS